MKYFAKHTLGLEELVYKWLIEESFSNINFHGKWVSFDGEFEGTIDALLGKCNFLEIVYNAYLHYNDDFSLQAILEKLNTSSEGLYRFVTTTRKGCSSISLLVSSPGRHDSEFSSDLAPILSKLKQLTDTRHGYTADVRIIDTGKGSGFVGLNLSKLSEAGYRNVKKDSNSIPLHIANSLVRISKPTSEDVFMDPFAGGGVIPLTRSELKCGYREIYAFDMETTTLVSKLKYGSHIDRLKLVTGDFLSSKSLGKNSISRVVTDPPWGFMDKNVNTSELYPRMFEKLSVLMKSGGLIVLLVSDGKLIRKVLNKRGNSFNLTNEYTIEISGRRASVFVIDKT